MAIERALVGRQVGEAAAGQLRHLVDRLEILVPRRRGPGSSQTLPIGQPQDRQRRQAARARPGCRRSDIPRSEWIAPPRAPIVSTTGTPQAAILLPSQTPPVSRQPIGWPRSAPQLFTSSNRRVVAASIGLGGRPKPPWTWMRDVMLGRDGGDRLVDQRLGARFVVRRRRAQVDAQHRMVGHDIVRPAAVDLRRIDLEARHRAPRPAAAPARRRRATRCGLPRDCARHGRRGR